MASSLPPSYEFGDFVLRPAEKRLLRAGEPVPLAPKVFDTLLLLVESPGSLVEKEVFLKRLWPDSFVEEVALAHGISQLRKALRDGVDGRKFIETVPKRGYRFVAPVAVMGAPPPETRPGVIIAVLPFANLGAGPERDYLADGLTEEVIASLGQVSPDDLRVIGRTSMMAYKGATKSLAEIGAELGAKFLVESSVRGEGQRLRITSRLVRAVDQVQIWSDSYDSERGSVLELQRELSIVIAGQVRHRLSPERVNALARRQTHDAEAYDLYLRGRYFWHQLSAMTTRRAIEYYTRATQLDPQYALAWAGLADAYSTNPISGDGDPRRIGPLAREASLQAVASEPGLAEVQGCLAFVKFWIDWDWPAAEQGFRASIALDPSYALAHRTLAIALSHLERPEEAAAAAAQARALDPLHAGHYALSAQVAFNGHDFAAAVEFARRATIIDPEFWIGHFQLGQALQQMDAASAALEALQQAWKFSGGNSKVLSLRGYILARLGCVQEAGEILHALQNVPRERYVPPYAIALVHAGLGHRDLALACLDTAWEVRDVHLAFLPLDPKWDALRDDSRFHALLNRCGFSQPTARLA
jgi:TolB-like protein/Flp pilus assembly protein TadD